MARKRRGVRGDVPSRPDSEMVKKEKKKAAADDENPENLPSQPTNTLFGKQTSATSKRATVEDAAANADAAKPAKRKLAPVSKEDPALALMREAKRAKRSDNGSASDRSPSKPAPGGGQKAVRAHADAVEQGNKLWERLRSEKTAASDREALVSEVLALFHGNVLAVLQKHDAARVLQSCYRQGTAEQRDTLLAEVKGEAKELARSHYGHFLLLTVLRHGTSAHRQQLLAELTPHAADLMVHAEGSAVLQLLYSDVASGEQKNGLFRALWAKEVAMLGASASSQFGSLEQLFELDPLCKGRVLRRLEILLSKAARKGLAVTSLVQRGAAEMLAHGDDTQRQELVNTFKEQAVHIMHTRDGARIACGCLRHGDAKDRKALLKALKGYVGRAACDPHGALVLCVALEAVDDTVLLAKGILAELTSSLDTLSRHPHGTLPLLQLLAPREKRHFSPLQLSLMGAPESAMSKKAPEVRRSELLPTLLPPLLRLCASQPAQLVASPHGAAVVYETLRLASASEAGLTLDTAAMAEALTTALTALAGVATEPPPAANADADADIAAALAAAASTPLVAHPYGARLYKRLVQAHRAFAQALVSVLAGKLADWALAGAGWVVLALLESPPTSHTVREELEGQQAALAASAAQGCCALSQALPPPVPGKGKKKAPAPAEEEAPTDKAGGKKKKVK